MDLNGNLKNKKLIAISGKKQSGKNTIAKIINQLTNNKYEEKCFADKLKDIVCILIGCSRDQLENESFKSKELGEEWYLYIVKNTYSNEILSPFFLTKEEARHWEQTQDWYEDTGGYDTCVELIKPTPRFLLQFIGTNLLRNQLHPNIWVNALMSEYKPTKDTKVSEFLKAEGLPETMNGGKEYPNWIITDLRFPNELEAVKERGGITIRVVRPVHALSQNNHCGILHPSETSLDNEEFDYTIVNDSTIEDLVEKVREILINEKLL